MRKLTILAVTAGLAVAAGACGGDDDGKKQTNVAAQSLKGVKLEIAAKWTGGEQANFEKVLDAFETKTGATVTYASTGEDTGAYLGPRLQGGNPPDVAVLPQPGLVQQYGAQKALKPLAPDVVAQLDANYTPYWKELGSVNGAPYGVLVKAAHKSLVWYYTPTFQEAGVSDPATWDDLLKGAQTVADNGTPAFSLCAASGWTLTDLFENLYLSSAGPENYDKLAKHEIPWTDKTVTAALTKMGQLFGKKDLILGGASGALQTDFPTCSTKVFGGKHEAAMVMEGDFVAESATQAGAKIGVDAQIFPFPKVGATAPVVLGGDVAVALKDSKGAMELLKFLASKEGGETWAKQPGYLSPNRNVAPSAYPNELTKKLAQTIITGGDSVRYDMSDLAPSAFGATDGKGEWKLLQDFLRNPSDVKGIQTRLEAEATKAWKK